MKIEYKYAVALTAALGLFMAVLDNTIVNVALTPMREAFNTDNNTIQWVITGYFLSQAAMIPAAGYLGNRFGIKPVFIGALAIFTLGSLLCGLSPLITSTNPELLIAFRVFQGIGGGALFPLATAISFNVFPPAERAKSSAVIAVPVLLGPTLGPTVGGLIVDSASNGTGWPGIFFINVPIGIIAIILIARILKPDTGQSGTRAAQAPQAADAGSPAPARPAAAGFDIIGLVLSMVGIVLVVYAFTVVSQTDSSTITPQNPQGNIYGWGYWLVWTLFAAGIVVLGLFGFYETRIAKDPVLDLSLFKSLNFSTATVATWLTRAVIFGSFFLLPVYFEQFKGFSAVTAGLLLMPQGLGAGIGIGSGSRLYDRVGPRTLVLMGMVTLTLSTLALVFFLDTNSDWTFFVPLLLVRGIGFGWSNLPLQTVALSSVTGRGLAKASSLYNASAQVFSSIGIAVITTIFIQSTKDGFTTATAAAVRAFAIANHINPTTPAGQQALAAALKTPAGQTAINNALLPPAVDGLHTTFLYITIGTILAIAVCFLLPAKSLKQQQEAAGIQNAEARPAIAME